MFGARKAVYFLGGLFGLAWENSFKKTKLRRFTDFKMGLYCPTLY